jgi:hypothetical protein
MSEQQSVISPLPVPNGRAILVDRRSPSDAGADARTQSWPVEALKWMFSFPAMLGVALVGRVFYEARLFNADPDAWWHIKVGQDILRTHHWPTVDPYSFSAANTPWIAYEWLGDVALAGVAKLGGIFALGGLRFFLAAGVVLLLYCYGALRSMNCKAGFVPAGLMASLVPPFFTLRPQMFGYVFLVLLLIVLELFRKGATWPIWTLPALFLLWVNTHGSFIVGIGVLGVYLCCGLKPFHFGPILANAWNPKQRLQLELALLGSIAVLPLTPYGTQLAVYPFDLALNQPLNTALVLEWGQMPLNESGGKLFLAVVVAMVALQLLFRFTWRLEEVLLMFGGTVLAFLHMRMLLIFVPFAVAILATMVARWIPPYSKPKEHYVLNGAVMAAVIGGMLYYIPSRESVQRSVDQVFPVKAVAYLDSHPVAGPMLNSYGFGGYLVGSGKKVFIDGRADLYERSGILSDYVKLTLMKPGAFQVLDSYRIDSCLLYRDEPLAVALERLPNWKRVYLDDVAALFVRKVPINEAGAD